MKTKKIYLLFSGTGTLLSRTIDLYTGKSLNHVSLSLDRALTRVYSFGRKRPSNPFSGGFVKEDFNSPLFNQTNCAIYELEVTEEAYNQLSKKISLMELEQHLYNYNFLGLLGVMFNIEFHRERAYFCSQFVAAILQKYDLYPKTKPACFVRPEDLRAWDQLKLIYHGAIIEYPCFDYQPENGSRQTIYSIFSYYNSFISHRIQQTKLIVLESLRHFRY